MARRRYGSREAAQRAAAKTSDVTRRAHVATKRPWFLGGGYRVREA